jgi:hypothetical protein
MAVAGVLATGLSGAADAKSTKKQRHSSNIVATEPLAPGDSLAKINRAYPVELNPPSLRQTYNVRGRKMNEFHH